jgi:REP element-mobilizing transposase RayT
MNYTLKHHQTFNLSIQSDSEPVFDSEEIAGKQLNSADLSTPPNEIMFEYVDQNPYDVSYTCLLLPRFPTYILVDDVASCIQKVVTQISISYEWQLTFLSIKSDHLQWTIRVPPSTSTTAIIHVIRKQTSAQVFSDFPNLKLNNESDDFWAPGYLIFSGSQPHPIEIVQRYIRQTRQHEGNRLDE